MKALARALRAVAISPTPMTSRELAAAVGIDYVRNFNKREKRYARKLAGFVVRRRLTGEEMQVPTRLLHWLLDYPWRGQSPDVIVEAFMSGLPHPTTRAAARAKFCS